MRKSLKRDLKWGSSGQNQKCMFFLLPVYLFIHLLSTDDVRLGNTLVCNASRKYSKPDYFAASNGNVRGETRTNDKTGCKYLNFFYWFLDVMNFFLIDISIFTILLLLKQQHFPTVG